MIRSIFLFLIFTYFPFASMFGVVYISLGGSCWPAIHLRNFGLRTQAYPFDWVMTSFDTLYEVLKDDFDFFLTDWQLRPDRNGIINHHGITFTHDWVTVNEFHDEDVLDFRIVSYEGWETHCPSVQAKYQRRIERFKSACMGQEKAVFVRAEFVTQAESVILRDFFRTKYPALDFILVVIKDDDCFENPWGFERILNFRGGIYDEGRWENIFKILLPNDYK